MTELRTEHTDETPITLHMNEGGTDLKVRLAGRVIGWVRKAERGGDWHAVELTERRTPRDLGLAPTLEGAIELVLDASC